MTGRAPTLFVCAVARELAFLRPSRDAEVLVAGIGPVEAAAATAAALARRPYGLVVNAGIGGVFRGKGAVGDAFAIADERFAELGFEGGGTLALPAGAALVAHAASDPDAVARLAAAGARVGRGITVATVTTTDRRAGELRARFDADVESMEGFAVLRAAERAGIPAVEVRGISNYVGDRAASGWDFAAGVAALERLLGALAAREDLRRA